MKILLLDIETAPHRVYAWGLWDQNIGLNQIEEPGYTLCWAAKWFGNKKMMFSSLYENGKISEAARRRMLEKAHALLDEADVVIHYYGEKFDIPTLNQEFLAMGFLPPSPYKQIDLLKTVKRQFRLASNKLDYVATHLGLAGKIEHKGMDLWRGCMAGDPAAWKVMERYNKRDVTLLEEVYIFCLPWIVNHPNYALYDDKGVPVCPNCGGTKLQRQGYRYTNTMRYRQHQCQDCGKWSRERINSSTDVQKANTLVGV